MTDTAGQAVNTARPPLGLAAASLLRADALVLLRNRVSGFVSLLLPLVIVVVTGRTEKKTARLGGPDLTIAGIDIYRIENDLLAEHWHVVDQLSMLGQLGLLPAAP